MSKCIHKIRSISKLTCKTSVREFQPFGNCDDNRTLLCRKLLHSLHEIIHIKGNFRQINHIRSVTTLASGKRCRCCQPSCMASHNLYDRNGRLLNAKALVIADNLFHRSCNIFCCGTISRTMVCNRKVVVNRLWNAHKPLWFALHCRIIGEHLNRIHRIISADIEQALDIIFL